MQNLVLPQIQQISCLAALVVPASKEYEIPGADDPQILAQIVLKCMSIAAAVKQHLVVLDELCRDQWDMGFVDLDVDAQMQAVVLDGREQSVYQQFAAIVVGAYYADPRVLTSLDLPGRAPFPQGHDVEQGDWSLLDVVKKRGRIYRPDGS